MKYIRQDFRHFKALHEGPMTTPHSHMTTFAQLVKDNLLEIGAGRPRSVSSDLPILRVADVLDGRIGVPPKNNVTANYPQSTESKVSKSGDIVLTTKGTIGRVAIMPADGPTFTYSPQLCYFRPSTKGPLHPRYLYYWFKTAEFWTQANSLKSQTDMADFLSLSDIHSLSIRIPPIEEQEKIVDVLGALDDKITVNECINSTTNALVSALFIQLLSSSREVVKVPLGDVAAVNMTSIRPAQDGVLRYVDISTVGTGFYEWPEPIKWSEAPGRARRKAKFGDTIWSTVRPNRRSHALVLDDDPDLVFSTGLAVLTPTSVGPAFLYEVTRTLEFQKYLESVAEGSAYPAVRAEHFKAALIPLPADVERTRFEDAAMAMRLRAHQAVLETRTLTALRDALLPQLMSGQLPVRDAKRITEDVS